MGSLGTGELLVIAIVALVVFGPKRLPELARKAGELLAKARAATRSLTESMESEYSDIAAPLQTLKSEYDATMSEIKNMGTTVTGIPTTLPGGEVDGSGSTVDEAEDEDEDEAEDEAGDAEEAEEAEDGSGSTVDGSEAEDEAEEAGEQADSSRSTVDGSEAEDEAEEAGEQADSSRSTVDGSEAEDEDEEAGEQADSSRSTVDGSEAEDEDEEAGEEADSSRSTVDGSEEEEAHSPQPTAHSSGEEAAVNDDTVDRIPSTDDPGASS